MSVAAPTHLDRELLRLRRKLGDETAPPPEPWEDIPLETSDPPLVRIGTIFGLTEFERNVLMTAVAAELDEAFAALIGRANGDGSAWPKIGLLLRMWEAPLEARLCFRPDSPLFRFELAQLDGSLLPLPLQSVRVPRRVADAVLGLNIVDAPLVPRVSFLRGATGAAPLAAKLKQARGGFFLHLASPAPADAREHALTLLPKDGPPLLCVSLRDFPPELIPGLIRECLLQQAALLLDTESELGGETLALIREAGLICFVTGPARMARPESVAPGTWLSLEVPGVSREERERLWAPAGRHAARLARRQRQSGEQVRAAIADARLAAWAEDETPEHRHFAAADRPAPRRRLLQLAQPLEALARWEDLELPADEKAKLAELCEQVNCQARVMRDYGFADALSRGKGVTALFAGPSGTGKTMAAEVVAGRAGRELYRVDLSQVVSKYIGETEKQLRELMGEAERGGLALLFDEADALFGRRSEVKDSHDRYANQEVSYLLQLLEETEHSLVLLATNRRDALDEAFLRRFRFVVDFPAPGLPSRRAIWSRVFPESVPVGAVDFDALAAALSVTGASIRNIALAAAYQAAADGGVVLPAMVAAAARRELAKLGRAQFVSAEQITLGGEA